MLQITYPGTGNNTQFTYDPMGRCAKMVETTAGIITSTKQFVWCGPRRCEQRDSGGTTVTGRFFALGEIDSSLAIHFYQKDKLGNVVGVTDSSGNPEASIEYDPFGNPNVLAGTFTPTFGFAGMYQHGRSGLNLTLFRAYSPASARWLSRDPLGANGGLNLYAYSGNNPISFVDPLGLCDDGKDPFQGGNIFTPGLNNFKNPGFYGLLLVGAAVVATAGGYAVPAVAGGGLQALGGLGAAGGIAAAASNPESVYATQEGFTAVQNHLAQFGDWPYNDAMLQRLQAAVASGQELVGADLNFYQHELYEAELMAQGMSQEAAHQAALQHYGIPQGALYAQEVMQQFSQWFSATEKAYWGIK